MPIHGDPIQASGKPKLSDISTEEMSSVATEVTSSVATGEMSSVASLLLQQKRCLLLHQTRCLLVRCPTNWVVPRPEWGRHGSPRADTLGKRSHGLQEGFFNTSWTSGTPYFNKKWALGTRKFKNHFSCISVYFELPINRPGG